MRVLLILIADDGRPIFTTDTKVEPDGEPFAFRAFRAFADHSPSVLVELSGEVVTGEEAEARKEEYMSRELPEAAR